MSVSVIYFLGLSRNVPACSWGDLPWLALASQQSMRGPVGLFASIQSSIR